MSPRPGAARLVIVDDHAIVRHGLRSILEREPSVAVVGEAADRTSTLATVNRLRPDLVLLDLKLADGAEAGGLDLCAELAERYPRLAVVVLTTFLDQRLVLEAIRRGAKGYVLKDVDVVDLVKIIRTVHRGERAFDTRSAAMIAQSFATAEDTPSPPRLTARERDVVRLVSTGHSNRQIGDALYISPSTVKFHVRNVLRKLDAATRAEAVYAASKLGLL